MNWLLLSAYLTVTTLAQGESVKELTDPPANEHLTITQQKLSTKLAQILAPKAQDYIEKQWSKAEPPDLAQPSEGWRLGSVTD